MHIYTYVHTYISLDMVNMYLTQANLILQSGVQAHTGCGICKLFHIAQEVFAEVIFCPARSMSLGFCSGQGQERRYPPRCNLEAIEPVEPVLETVFWHYPYGRTSFYPGAKAAVSLSECLSEGDVNWDVNWERASVF